jgi:hypothetical protein
MAIAMRMPEVARLRLPRAIDAPADDAPLGDGDGLMANGGAAQQKSAPARRGAGCWSDDGDLMAPRVGHWKATFLVGGGVV